MTEIFNRSSFLGKKIFFQFWNWIFQFVYIHHTCRINSIGWIFQLCFKTLDHQSGIKQYYHQNLVQLMQMALINILPKPITFTKKKIERNCIFLLEVFSAPLKFCLYSAAIQFLFKSWRFKKWLSDLSQFRSDYICFGIVIKRWTQKTVNEGKHDTNDLKNLSSKVQKVSALWVLF